MVDMPLNKEIKPNQSNFDIQNLKTKYKIKQFKYQKKTLVSQVLKKWKYSFQWYI